MTHDHAIYIKTKNKYADRIEINVRSRFRYKVEFDFYTEMMLTTTKNKLNKIKYK